MRTYLMIGLAAAMLMGCSYSDGSHLSERTEFAKQSCQVGVYGSADPFVAITKRDSSFRYSFSDGRWGEINDNTIVECSDGAVRVEHSIIWDRQPIKVTDTVFDADGVMLAGQLLEPTDAGNDTPLVALAHGSEELGWIEASSYPYQIVGRGISVFVYDKRGTGKSGGNYSQNFPQLADDLVAASLEAKRLAGGRFGRFGLLGFSQGGWIAPLAAERSGADFIGIGYGLVVDILEEDASQVELELREAGYGDEVIGKAKEITDVTARLAVSGYSDGLEELDAFQKRHGKEEWFRLIRGGFTGVLLGMSTDELRDNGIPMFDRLNIDWSIKPMDVLRDVDVPQLWILAADDREAPISKTLEGLELMKSEGKDVTIFRFPHTDHGMWEYTQAPDGTRTRVRVTDEYYNLLADWARGSLQPPYAKSTQR